MLKVATQHCLRIGGAAGFNYGSVLSWETANFHSHISSLVMFSHCILHDRSLLPSGFQLLAVLTHFSPSSFTSLPFALLHRFCFLNISFPLGSLCCPWLLHFFLFFLFSPLSHSIHFHLLIFSFLLFFPRFFSHVLSTLLLSLSHFYFLLCCFLPLSFHLILHSLLSFLSLFLPLVLPLSGPKKRANFHLIASLITVSPQCIDYPPNFSLLI